MNERPLYPASDAELDRRWTAVRLAMEPPKGAPSGLRPSQTRPTMGAIHQRQEGPMSKITYEIVEHDGGWAYRVDGVYSEPFPPTTRPAEPRSVRRKSRSFPETRRASPMRTRKAAGTMSCRKAAIAPRPGSRAETSKPYCFRIASMRRSGTNQMSATAT